MKYHICNAAVVLAFFLTALAGGAAHAQETRIGEEGFVSPDARLEQIEWLIGDWSGTGVGGNLAQESWSQPVGDTMVGTFIQTDDTGAILFTELMYITELDGSLVLRLKHFNPDMTSWEEKDEVQSYRLVAIEECAAFFQGLTIRCEDPSDPYLGLVVAVRAGKDEEGRVRELIFRYDGGYAEDDPWAE